MADGKKLIYSDTEIAEFNAFKDWYTRLGGSGQSSIRARYGNLFGVGAGNPDSISEYKNSVYYKAFKEAGGGVGVTETTEAKAAQYVTDQQAFKGYQSQGGKLDFTTWLRSGKPSAEAAAGGVSGGLGGISQAVRWGSIVENGYVWQIGYDKDGNIVSRDAIGRAPEAETTTTGYQQGQIDLERDRLNEEIRQFNEKMSQSGQMSDYEKEMMELNRLQLNESIRQFNSQQQLSQQQMQQQSMMQEEMINWYREQQAADLEAQKQERLAQLRANPASWLEYASLSGETPVVQPWMVPLSPESYNMQAGQALPGWTPQSEGQSLSSLPELTKPSAQYSARIAPSARQQYYGYEQARTGATPEDVEWRLWNQAPPGAAGGGLRYAR
jgi:hypothetical protein